MIKAILTVVIGSAMLASCTPFKMAVSDSLKQEHDEYSVAGRQGILIKQKMSFGEYYTTDIKRSWTKGGSSGFGIGKVGPTAAQFENLISIEYIKRKQTIRFELTDGKQNSQTYCVTKFNAKDLSIGKYDNSILNIGLDLLGLAGWSESTYYVQIYTKDNDRPWEMLIDNQAAHARSKTYTGMLTLNKDKYYTIVPVTQMEKNGKTGTALANLGFEFRDASGKAIAAVSLIDKGMVFLGKTSVEERLLLANACTALLLQEEIG